MDHNPVLLPQAVAGLNLVEGGVYIDGTFGAGGYTRALLEQPIPLQVLAIDRDPHVVETAQALAAVFPGRLKFVQTRFGLLEEAARDLGFSQVDGVVLDIGVSSMQLDRPDRGFSFRFDGPLDMRMSEAGVSAADLVNEASEAHLADIFHFFGEERRARSIARTIVKVRAEARIETTHQLSEIVARVVRAEPNGPHPATRTFQALRIAVNDELAELVGALHAAERILKPGGRLAVVTFHSLEDRIVKQFLMRRSSRAAGLSRHAPLESAQDPTFTGVDRLVTPSYTEIAANPRSRSAKLRVAERSRAPAQEQDDAVAHLAALPSAPLRGHRS